MPEVFGVPELVSWSSKHFDMNKRVIHVGDNIVLLISLSPLIFQKMMKLAKPNKEPKLAEADKFIANHGGPKILLTYFIDSLFGVRTNAF
jgi:hypothetical protein